jgi:hypothetical protein
MATTKTKTAKCSKGSRKARWEKEFDELFGRLKKTDPHSPEFHNTVDRLWRIGLHAGHKRYGLFRDELPALVDPALAEAVARINKQYTGLASVYYMVWPDAKAGWEPQVMVHFHQSVSIENPTAQCLESKIRMKLIDAARAFIDRALPSVRGNQPKPPKRPAKAKARQQQRASKPRKPSKAKSVAA